MKEDEKPRTASVRIRSDLVQKAKMFAQTRRPKSTIQYVLEDAIAEYFAKHAVKMPRDTDTDGTR
jgi:predicted transcriptional regulator